MRKTAAEMASITPMLAELALHTDAEILTVGDEATAGGKWVVAMVPRASLAEGDTLQWRSDKWERVPRQSEVADAPTDIASLTFSDPPTQAECEALQAKLVSTTARLNELLAALRATGGNGTIAD